MADLMPQEARVTAWLSSQRDAMLALVSALVNIDSGTYHKPGVDAVANRIAQFFASQAIDPVHLRNEVYGDCVRVSIGTNTNSDSVLMMGHMDTVFKVGEASRRPFKIRDGRGYGPGVADMKSGLVMNAFVMAALKATNAVPRPLTLLFTSDEEIGSPASRQIIEDTSRSNPERV